MPTPRRRRGHAAPAGRHEQRPDLPGQGPRGAAQTGAGDLLVTVEVVVPQRLTDAASKALRAYAEAAPEDPRASLFEGGS